MGSSSGKGDFSLPGTRASNPPVTGERRSKPTHPIASSGMMSESPGSVAIHDESTVTIYTD